MHLWWSIIISSPKPDELHATTPAGLLSAHLRPRRPVMSATAYAPISALSPALTGQRRCCTRTSLRCASMRRKMRSTARDLGDVG